MAKSSKKKVTPALEEATIIPILDGEYQLVNMPLQRISVGIGEYDLNTLTEAQADTLIDLGCKWISKTVSE